MRRSESILSRFPKKRPQLPEEYRAIYVEHYKRNREGASPASAMAQKLESWMHRKIAGDVASNGAARRTLEVGAGNLNHLAYEPESQVYDIVEPFAELYENAPARSRVSHVYRSLDEVSGQPFDRILSIATFEHLCDLPAVAAQCGRLLAPGGELRVAIPSEGTLLWGMGWRLTTGIEFRLRHGLDYGVLMKHEHVNSAAEIAEVLRFFFKSVEQNVLGISPALSFYQFFRCTEPDRKRCSEVTTIFTDRSI